VLICLPSLDAYLDTDKENLKYILLHGKGQRPRAKVLDKPVSPDKLEPLQMGRFEGCLFI
jgi:hypothetical protein